MSKKKDDKAEFTPLATAKERILDFGRSHMALTNLGAAAAVIAMGILLFWFVNFSGYTAPATFIYAGF
ncbi:MAG: hypothetical protein ACI361_05345 [Atopobiaceae bacterium]